jgi:hypothetical protein
MSFGKVYLASQKTLVNASQYFRIYHVKLIGRKGMAQFFEPVPKLIDCSLNAHGFGTASFDNIFNGFIINAESLEKMFFEKKSVIFTTKISEQGNKVRIDVFLMSDFGIDSTGNLAEFLRIVNNENEGFPPKRDPSLRESIRARDRSGISFSGQGSARKNLFKRIARFPAPDPEGLKAPEMRPKFPEKSS